MRPTLRRLLVGAAALAAATTVPVPAHAAGPQVTQLVPDATVAAGYDTLVAPILYASQATELTNPVTTFELSGPLDGVALASPDGSPSCTADGPRKLTCARQDSMNLDEDGIVGYFVAKLSATKAALGETGKMKVTFTADGITPVATTVDVAVAEAVDLAAGANSTVSVKPGDTFDAGLQVHNNADTAARGAAIVFKTDYAFQATKKFSNCFYDGDHLSACVFDQELAPGRSYRLSVPYQARKDTMAPGESFGEFEWLGGDDYADLAKFIRTKRPGWPGTAGAGGKLELNELPATTSLTKQTDPDEDNNWQRVELKVTGNQGTDLAAVGATVTAAAGQTVPVTVGVRNLGPATLDLNRVGEWAAVVLVTAPPGTTAAKIPQECELSDDWFPSKPGVAGYVCFSHPLFPAGTSVSWTFELKVDKASANALGSVEVNPACACDIFAGDLNKANNTAKIVLNPTGGPGGTGGQGGTGGGSLPITGPRTALVGGAGAVLVAAGVVGFLIARRRRTRFEA